MFRISLNRCKRRFFHLFQILSLLTVLCYARNRSVVRNTRKKVIIVRNARRFRLQIISFSLLFFIVSHARAQSAEITIGLNRLDYQLGIGYGHHWRHFQFTPKFEIGMTSTFKQSRLFPRYSIGTGYFVLRSKTLELGPELTYAYSRLRLTNNGKTAHHWNEILFGYRLQVGRAIKLVHSANCGWMNESFYNNTLNKRVNFNSFGFYAQVGFNYTF